jgi:hypothetical protein
VRVNTPKGEQAMPKESSREDLDHKPENAGKVGEQHEQANQEGEQPRHPTPPEGGERDKDGNHNKP